MESSSVFRCDFCGSTHIKLPMVSIALSMGGRDYSFCEECLKGMTADEFWQQIFKMEDYAWPPKLADWAQEAVDKGIHPEEARWGWGKNSKITIPSSPTPKITKSRINHIEKERRKMTNSLRYKIMRRDSFCCVLCGATGKDDSLVVDHIVPIVKGGKTKESNLRTLCSKCNSGKGTKTDKIPENE